MEIDEQHLVRSPALTVGGGMLLRVKSTLTEESKDGLAALPCDPDEVQESLKQGIF